MQMRSELAPKEYLQALMNRMDTVTRFGEERFTGMRLGKFFYVIHHSEHQWDRRFNNPKNAALGYVKAADEGCQVHFMKFKGMLCPSQFLLYFVISVLASYLTNSPPYKKQMAEAFALSYGYSFNLHKYYTKTLPNQYLTIKPPVALFSENHRPLFESYITAPLISPYCNVLYSI